MPLDLTRAALSFMARDSRGLPGMRIFSGVKRGEPSTDGLAERLNLQPAVDFGETIEL